MGHQDTQLPERVEIVSGWQPIETAPRKGRVLLYFGGAPENVAPVASGFYSVFDGHHRGDGFGNDAPLPTHWMPLPEPPA